VACVFHRRDNWTLGIVIARHVATAMRVLSRTVTVSRPGIGVEPYRPPMSTPPDDQSAPPDNGIDLTIPSRAVGYPEVMAIRVGDRYNLIRLTDVYWIQAEGNYSRIYTQQRQRLVTKNLSTLQDQVLDPRTFLRVHRSAIVNFRKIAAIDPHAHGDMTLVLLDGTCVQCSRRYREQLELLIYFST